MYDYIKVNRILEVLDKPKSLIEIMRKTEMSYVTVRRYIDFMEKQGLVKKKRISRGNRTVKVLIEKV